MSHLLWYTSNTKTINIIIINKHKRQLNLYFNRIAFTFQTNEMDVITNHNHVVLFDFFHFIILTFSHAITFVINNKSILSEVNLLDVTHESLLQHPSSKKY